MTAPVRSQPYDVIGDVHGHASTLEALLGKLGYSESAGAWRHPEGRKVVFLGDFIDRGGAVRRTLEIVRGMVQADQAIALMGNHEFNAVLYHTPNGEGGWLRPRVEKNVRQHSMTLAQFWDYRDEWEDNLAWFSTLPLWVDLGGFRAVHAQWGSYISEYPHWRIADPDLIRRASVKGSTEHQVLNTLLKGSVMPLPPGYTVTDENGLVRKRIRVRWWVPAQGKTLRALSIPDSDEVPHVPAPEACARNFPGYPADAPPVFFGHYWMQVNGGPAPLQPNVACLDFSVANGGVLAAYRWDGELILDPEKFVYAEVQPERKSLAKDPLGFMMTP